jgi:hypothetical protein
MDSKSIGLCPQGFESPRCRFGVACGGRFRSRVQMTPAGLEPAIPGSVGRCLIHWATGPLVICNADRCVASACVLAVCIVVVRSLRCVMCVGVCACSVVPGVARHGHFGRVVKASAC